MGRVYRLLMKTLEALGVRHNHEGWSIVFYGFGFPVYSMVARYVVEDVLLNNIFSLVTGFLDVPTDNSEFGDVENGVLPDFMLRQIDGER